MIDPKCNAIIKLLLKMKIFKKYKTELEAILNAHNPDDIPDIDVLPQEE